MDMRRTASIIVALAAALFFSLPNEISSAQEGGRRGAVKTTPETPNRGGERIIIRNKSLGALSVVSPEGARVVIVRLNGGKTEEKVVPPGAMQAIFNDLLPGQYRVTSSLDGYVTRTETVTIVRNQPTPLNLTLEPITHRVTIATNAGAGQIRYGLPGGALDRLARMDETGKATIEGLQEGKYEIEIEPDDLSYRPRKETMTVGKGRVDFKFNLDRKLSETPFFADFSRLREWEAPGGWRTTGKFLSITEAGVALAPGEDYRHYQDLDLNVIVNIKQGEAQFAVRARDKQNFYRIRVIAKPDGTGELRGALVRAGRERDLLPQVQPILTLPDGLLNRDLEVIIQAKGNRICVKIIDSLTAHEFLGALVDSSGSLQIGAPGLAGAAGATTEVKQFIARKLAGPTNCEPQ